LLLLDAQVLEYFGGKVVREHTQQHRHVFVGNVGQDLRQIRRGEFAENLAELIEVALPDQFSDLRLEQAADHSRPSNGRRPGASRNKGSYCSCLKLKLQLVPIGANRSTFDAHAI